MNPVTCQQALDSVGTGVATSLHAVDCAANATAQAAFGRLFGHGGGLLPALTILLTLYVAFFAFSLITGRSRIGIAALTPRMVTLGLVLTFATSWVAYQGVMWNLAVGAPDEIASLLTGSQGAATDIFAQKIDVVFAALAQISDGQAMAGAQSTFSPPGLLWLGATLLLLGTVGVIATSKIALAILMALGPLFVVLALFKGTRGLFTGWLKGVVMLALTPLFAVLGGSLMLELAVPVINALVTQPGKIEAQPAMAFFMIGAVHAALMIMVLKVAATMVSGWTVFGLAGSAGDSDSAPATAAARSADVLPVAAATAATVAPQGSATQRQIRVAAVAAGTAANDTGAPAGVVRSVRITETGHAAGAAGQPATAISRARGIGSRFRTPAPRTAIRSLEK